MPRLPVLLASALFAVLNVLSLSYLTRELVYDEAVYLTLAREVTQSGLPLRRQPQDLRETELFQNSPPLIIYLASLSQWITPGAEKLPRLVHYSLFVLPTFALVWWIARRLFGDWAAVGGLAALVGSGSYLSRVYYVQADVPLGLIALTSLLLFERACDADDPARRWRFALGSGGLLVLATWTKYQAICVAVAVGLYTLVRAAQDVNPRRLAIPFLVMGVSGLLAVMCLLAYFIWFDTAQTLASTIDYNTGRMQIRAVGGVVAFRAFLAVAGKIVHYLGGPLLVMALLAVSQQVRHRGLVVILGLYALTSIAFNLFFHRLPGAGSYYLNSLVPSLALLAAAGTGVIVERAPSRALAALCLGLVASVQFVGTPPPLYLPPYSNPARLAAEYIGGHSTRQQAVLATNAAVEFYVGNPVRLTTRAWPALLLASLRSTGPESVDFVLLDREGVPAGAASVAPEWNDLLERHFHPVNLKTQPLRLYERNRPVTLGH